MRRTSQASPVCRQLPLHELTALGIIRRMQREDRRALEAVVRAEQSLAKAVGVFRRTLEAGGRVFFLGAGTSGRLGVMEAAECPPTFGVAPERVMGLIAGGPKAFARSREGAEDRRRQGRLGIARLRVGRRDLVVGISASGQTPFVLAALAEARKRGARTIFLTCTRRRGCVPCDLRIVLGTGTEIVDGSTRLKAGTATKLALNQITTAAFAQSGRVYGDQMVGVLPLSRKLMRRAKGVLARLGGMSPVKAARLLRQSRGDVRCALVMHLQGISRAQAVRTLGEDLGALHRILDRARGPLVPAGTI